MKTEIKKVVYGYVDNKNFVGPNNKAAVINELLMSDDVGYNLTGYQCQNCGFIYMNPKDDCEICEGESMKA